MSPKQTPLRIVALTAATLVAAYLSRFYWGGVLVFGNRIKSVADFCFVYVPILVLPIALLAWWKSRAGAILWAVVILVNFVPELAMSWPHVGAVAAHVLRLVWPFLVGWALLVLVALSDRRNSRGENA